jgi:hypothetical protein
MQAAIHLRFAKTQSLFASLFSISINSMVTTRATIVVGAVSTARNRAQKEWHVLPLYIKPAMLVSVPVVFSIYFHSMKKTLVLRIHSVSSGFGRTIGFVK